MTTILIADDEASIRTILSRTMEKKGCEVLRAKNGSEALQFLKGLPIDVALLDIRMPDMSGLEFLNHQKEYPSHPFIFMMTAQDTMENAVEAMKRGAYDYITKPFDLDELSLLVDRALEARRLQTEIKMMKEEVGGRDPLDAYTLVGKSKPIQEIYKMIGKVANEEVSILIYGESGTGKELVAKAIHFKGNRAPYPFVALNCSAIPRDLLESELFGHKKGAFTGAVRDKIGSFEQAHLGTLFLDEIGDLPLPLQAKLLRVLQEKEIQKVGDTKTFPINVRIVAATNQSLENKVRKGEFREDLYFRLNVVPLILPALRERKSDIPLLAEYFLGKMKNYSPLGPKAISPSALNFLKEQKWPGNIRELENLVKRASVLSQGTVLEKRDFEILMTANPTASWIENRGDSSFSEFLEKQIPLFLSRLSLKEEDDLYDKILPLLEKPLISFVLEKMKGNQIQAARLLGINRNTLRKKIRELKIK